MKGFILAAGFGSRMQELTSQCPKPLLEIAGYPLIYYTLYNLYQWGVTEVVINLHYLGHQIKNALQGFPYFPLQFSEEKAILDTAGGIRLAMDSFMYDDESFVLINPDTIFLPKDIDNPVLIDPKTDSSWLYLKPDQNSRFTGLDFIENSDSIEFKENGSHYYIGLSVMNTAALKHLDLQKKHSLGSIWRQQADNNSLKGRVFSGKIIDVGTKKDYLKIKDKFPLDNDFQANYKQGFIDFVKTWKSS